MASDCSYPVDLEHLDFVERGPSTKIRLFHGDKHKHFWCVFTRQSAILYHKISRKVIIILLEALSSIDLLQMRNGSFVLYGIMGDEVIGYDISGLVKDARHNKKKRLPTSGGDAASLPASKKTRMEEGAGRSQVNNGIFDTILGDSEMGGPGQSGEIGKLFGEIVHLEEKFSIYKGDKLIDCMLLDGVLVVLNGCPGGHIISFHQFRLPDFSIIPTEMNTLACAIPFASYFLQGGGDRTSSRRTLLAIENRDPGSNSQIGVKQVLRVEPPLCGTMLTMATEDEATVATPVPGHLCPESFRRLFGSELAGLNSNVVILGTEAGKVLWVPLKSKDQSYDAGVPRTERPSILYDLHEPVVLATSIKLNGTQGFTAGHDSLVFVGQRGKFVLLLCEREVSNTGQRSRTKFTEKLVKGCVTSPVVVNSNRMVYSTLREVVTLKIELVARKGEASNHSDVRLTEARYPLKDIVSLAKLPVRTSGSDIELVTCSSLGKVSKLHLDGSAHLDDAVAMTTHQCGQRMKELMLSIQDITQRTENLRLAAKRQNTDLSEITKAGHLARLLAEDAGSSPDHAPPFTLRCHISHTDEGSKRSEVLRCKILNKTEWTFATGWSLCAYAYNTGHSAGLPEVQGHMFNSLSRPVVSVTYPLGNWKPGLFTVLSFSLDDGRVSSSSPILVKLFLHFLPSSPMEGFSRHLAWSPESPGSPGNATGVLFPITSKRVDILNFLQPVGGIHVTPEEADPSGRGFANQSGSVPMDTSSKSDPDWLAHTLQVIASQQQRIVQQQERERSQDVLRTSNLVLTKETQEKVLPKGTGLLRWLFEDNPEVISLLQSASVNSIQVLSPSGAKVHLLLTEVDNSGVKLQINTTSPKLFAEVWEAVHFRLNSSLQFSEGGLQPDTDRVKLMNSIKVIERKLTHLSEKQVGQVQRGDLEEVYEDLRKLNMKF